MLHVIWTVWSAPTPMELIGFEHPAFLCRVSLWLGEMKDQCAGSVMEAPRIILLLLHRQGPGRESNKQRTVYDPRENIVQN